METLTYNPQVKYRLLYVGGAVIMTALSAWLLFLGVRGDMQLTLFGNSTPSLFVLIGLLGILFFGFALIFFGKRLISPKPALELRADGIIDNSTAMATKMLIPYSNIEKASVQTFMTNTYVNLDIINEEAVLQSVSKMKQSTMTINRDQFGAGLVLISLNGYTYEELETISQEINNRIQQN